MLAQPVSSKAGQKLMENQFGGQQWQLRSRSRFPGVQGKGAAVGTCVLCRRWLRPYQCRAGLSAHSSNIPPEPVLWSLTADVALSPLSLMIFHVFSLLGETVNYSVFFSVNFFHCFNGLEPVCDACK